MAVALFSLPEVNEYMIGRITRSFLFLWNLSFVIAYKRMPIRLFTTS